MINPVELKNDELYFADKSYMSVSRFKKLEKCQVDGLEDWDDTNKSKALMVGSYVDAYVEGTLDEFKEKNPNIISTRGASKGQLKAEFKQADDICEYIDNDPTIQQFLSGDKQTVMTGEINGVPFKIKIDSYSEGIAINDLKCMRSVTDSNGEFVDFISPWGYDIQMACYQEIVRQNTGQQLPCFIVAVTKESPINSVIINVPQEVLDRALYRVESQIVELNNVFKGLNEPQGCGTCKTCVSKRTDTPIISMNDLLL